MIRRLQRDHPTANVPMTFFLLREKVISCFEQPDASPQEWMYSKGYQLRVK